MFRLITSSNSANVPEDVEALANAARSSCPIPAFRADTTDSNGCDVVRPKRSTSTFLTGIWIVPFGLMLALTMGGVALCEAAIDKQLRSRHVARIIRCEKDYRFGDLIRLSEPAERYYIRDHLQPLLPRF